jgi:hypothetical protein
LPLQIERLEMAVFNIPLDSIADYNQLFKSEYGELWNLYCKEVIQIGSPDNSAIAIELSKFRTDPTMNQVYERVLEVYPNLNDLENQLGRAFYRYNKELPNMPIPHIYTMISGFNQSMMTSDSILAIALDKYLGKNEQMYSLLGIPLYVRQTMDSKYLAADCMRAWLYTEFPFSATTDNVLSNMLYEGKIMYAVSRMLPHSADSIIFGFTPEQIQWCKQNAAQMWTSLIENRILFSADQALIGRLIDPAPFTSIFSNQSPGRASVWIGYQIVKSYMKRNKTSLHELLSYRDYQQILDNARYRP